MTVADFWTQQSFAHLETYSFNRGPGSAAEYERLSQEIAATRQALQTARHLDLAKLRHKLRQLEQEFCGGDHNVLLTDPSATNPYSTHRIATLPAHSAEAEQLGALLAKATEQEAFAGCPPIFRDALVFFDAQGQRVRVLNICFECSLMRTAGGQLLEADFATYEALQQLLLQWGHPIADDYQPTADD